MTTGANVWIFLVYHIIAWFCAKIGAEAIAIFLLVYFISDFVRQWWLQVRVVMISRVTASGSGMCGVLAFVLFFH